MASEEEKTTVVVEPEEKGITRRAFVRGLAATGAGMAVASSGLFGLASAVKASPYYLGSIPKEKLIWMYETMLKAREFDLTYMDGIVSRRLPRGTGFHPCVGEEATMVGAAAPLEEKDWVFCTYRNTAYNMARGLDPKAMAAEAINKATGANKGYGTHSRTVDIDKHVPGNNALVGQQALAATGCAFGLKVLGSDAVVLTSNGDGHFNTMDTLSALNEAANFSLPVVFVSETNGYSIWVPVSSTMKIPNIAQRAAGFGMPGEVVDGMDILAVYTVTKRAVERARSGGGPTLLDMQTYRYYDHSGVAGFQKGVLGGFRLGYRPDSELRSWLAKDPIEKHKRFLVQEGILTEAEAQDIREKVRQEIADAFELAIASPVPVAEDGVKNVFIGETVLPRQLADCPLY